MTKHANRYKKVHEGLEYVLLCPVHSEVIRALVCKNQTKSKFRGKGGKFDFFHILILDRLGYN